MSHRKNKDLSEHDAAHIRFCEQGSLQVYRCKSCMKFFEASNKVEIMEHFVKTVHNKCESNCLYCQGPVYKYSTRNGSVEFHHNCLPVKVENYRSRKS